MPIDDLLPHYLAHLRERGRTEDTLKTFTFILNSADEALPFGLDIATERELRTWIWRDGLQEASRATYYGAINSFYRWAVERASVLDFNPCTRIDRPRVPLGLPRVASDAQVEQLLTRAAEPFLLWSKLASYAGLRCIEVCRLERADIGADVIKVRRGKGNKAREIPTHPVIWDAVRDLPGGPIADGRDQHQISRSFLIYCRDRLDLRNLSMHRLRGWFATKAYLATRDIRAVQKLLGHSDPATTARYIGVADAQIQAAIAGLPTIGGGSFFDLAADRSAGVSAARR